MLPHTPAPDSSHFANCLKIHSQLAKQEPADLTVTYLMVSKRDVLTRIQFFGVDCCGLLSEHLSCLCRTPQVDLTKVHFVIVQQFMLCPLES